MAPVVSYSRCVRGGVRAANLLHAEMWGEGVLLTGTTLFELTDARHLPQVDLVKPLLVLDHEK